MKFYRLLGASLGWFAIFTQYWLSTTEDGVVHGTIIYFSYFSILGNILVATAFTAPLLPASPSKDFFLNPGVRTAIGVYILIIAVIFHLLLRNVEHVTGLGWYDNALFHYIMPLLYLLDWVVFVPKRDLTFRQIPFWLIFPVAYVCYTLAHGAASGFYPYPFLDVRAHGYPQILTNIGGLTMLFIGVSGGFIVVGRYVAIPLTGESRTS